MDVENEDGSNAFNGASLRTGRMNWAAMTARDRISLTMAILTAIGMGMFLVGAIGGGVAYHAGTPIDNWGYVTLSGMLLMAGCVFAYVATRACCDPHPTQHEIESSGHVKIEDDSTKPSNQLELSSESETTNDLDEKKNEFPINL